MNFIPESLNTSHLNFSQNAKEKVVKFFMESYLHNFCIEVSDEKLVISARCHRSIRIKQNPHSVEVKIDRGEVDPLLLFWTLYSITA